MTNIAIWIIAILALAGLIATGVGIKKGMKAGFEWLKDELEKLHTKIDSSQGKASVGVSSTAPLPNKLQQK